MVCDAITRAHHSAVIKRLCTFDLPPVSSSCPSLQRASPSCIQMWRETSSERIKSIKWNYYLICIHKMRNNCVADRIKENGCHISCYSGQHPPWQSRKETIFSRHLIRSGAQYETKRLYLWSSYRKLVLNLRLFLTHLSSPIKTELV